MSMASYLVVYGDMILDGKVLWLLFTHFDYINFVDIDLSGPYGVIL